MNEHYAAEYLIAEPNLRLFTIRGSLVALRRYSPSDYDPGIWYAAVGMQYVRRLRGCVYATSLDSQFHAVLPVSGCSSTVSRRSTVARGLRMISSTPLLSSSLALRQALTVPVWKTNCANWHLQVQSTWRCSDAPLYPQALVEVDPRFRCCDSSSFRGATPPPSVFQAARASRTLAASVS